MSSTHTISRHVDLKKKCRHSLKKKIQVFLGCSGPLDNARTIPEWLKNNLKNFEKMLFFFNNCHIKIAVSSNSCSTNNL